MTFPIQLAFHHMERSEALEQAIRERSEKLGKFHPGITNMHVAVTLAGIMLPSTLLTIGATRWAQARQHRIGIRAFKAGLAPITIALLAATGWVLTAQNPAPPVIVLTAITALLAWRTRIHVLWLIAAGAIAGAAGLV